MNKAELIEQVADETDLSKADVSKVVDSFVKTVITNLKQGDTVTVAGFGTFAAPERAAREGRNPKTGETILIPSAKAPKFKPSTNFKKIVNDKATV